jgi:hypothetical protein
MGDCSDESSFVGVMSWRACMCVYVCLRRRFGSRCQHYYHLRPKVEGQLQISVWFCPL